jgi:hypothetical protein
MRVGKWYIDKNYDMVYLIDHAPREEAMSVPRYHAILFYKSEVRWCIIYFRTRDWQVTQPGLSSYHRAIERIFEGAEE